MNMTVYRVFDGETLLYVGCSMRGAERIPQHSGKPWWTRATRVELEHFTARRDALDAERRAIWTERPEFNLAGIAEEAGVSVADLSSGRKAA